MVNVDAPLLRLAQRTKVAAYKLVINAAVDLPLSPAHYQTNVHREQRDELPAIIAVRRVPLWIWKQFAPTTNPLLPSLHFSYFSPLTRPDINPPRTTIITILTNWNIRGARVQIAAGNEGRGCRFNRNFFLFFSIAIPVLKRGTLVNLTRSSSDLKSFMPLWEF